MDRRRELPRSTVGPLLGRSDSSKWKSRPRTGQGSRARAMRARTRLRTTWASSSSSTVPLVIRDSTVGSNDRIATVVSGFTTRRVPPPHALVSDLEQNRVLLNSAWPRRTLGFLTAEQLWKRWQIPCLDRSELGADVDELTARFAADTKSRASLESRFILGGFRARARPSSGTFLSVGGECVQVRGIPDRADDFDNATSPERHIRTRQRRRTAGSS